MSMASAHLAIWSIASLSILGVIVRPLDISEALWAVLGAGALVLFSLLSASEALGAILRGTDVYLFLVGMMLLANLARQEGLFDWLAAYAVKHAAGSASRLFLLVYAVGTIVTIFLSNDATAVVLTPAVYQAAKKAQAAPLPYLFICAFIANAASFVLPISNPANLVVYGSHLPTLSTWISGFGLASVVSILATYGVLRVTQRAALGGSISQEVNLPTLTTRGRVSAVGIGTTAIILLIASSRDWALGLPTFLAGAVTAAVLFAIGRSSPLVLMKEISWSILPLVAGLFVLVQGIEKTDILALLAHGLTAQAQIHPQGSAMATGTLVAFVSNVVNNLPMGLLAGTLASTAQLSHPAAGALLIGVDLGPNLSVTGSLATILWLVAIRREGQNVSAVQFLALGALVMPPALLGSLATYTWLSFN